MLETIRPIWRLCRDADEWNRVLHLLDLLGEFMQVQRPDAETAMLMAEMIKTDRAAQKAGRNRALQTAMHIVQTEKYPDSRAAEQWLPR